ncbi:MAG: hypothetical protein KHX75_09285 [Lachnospiraceae bacterium]|nr:hypothetical protein [Lachnospiraceae bacterium]
MIPKIIHYCWFGRGKKSDLILKCIDSWKKYCPDYEIIEWNEDNFDVDFCDYSRDAYQAKKWAFVSDIVRLKVLYDNGGIYLDTDVELHSNFDDLLQYDAWFAQDDIRYINTGLGFGAVKGNELIGVILSKRLRRKYDMVICNAVDTPIIRQYLGCKQSRESQCLRNIYIVGMNDYSKYAKHWEGNSWKDEDDRAFQNHRRNRFWKLKCWLRNPNLINWLERNGETALSKTYIFFAYDFLDNGLYYFIKRIWSKIMKR